MNDERCQSNPDVALIDKVPGVLAVLKDSLVSKLLEVVVGWVNEA